MLIAFPAQFTFNQRESPLATLRAICLSLKSPSPPLSPFHTSSSFLSIVHVSYVPWTEYVKARSSTRSRDKISNESTDRACLFLNETEQDYNYILSLGRKENRDCKENHLNSNVNTLINLEIFAERRRCPRNKRSKRTKPTTAPSNVDRF